LVTSSVSEPHFLESFADFRFESSKDLMSHSSIKLQLVGL
jgi:hypothetical protein